ncbi:hypothetical protein Glaag_1546 [Glaciecola sp. 4H-3-7+YE-5]|jgi:hypothetical protein|uniref:Uncharacterized protein n=1 Tax=Paraglaciecola chathamensis S18K6 TaxID=1127672 RepID=A0AAV3V510_9ALTE|nr:hypothetical protein Glaag_1546 [Glaciecola sp. 4H-3-7+YE-5]GAC11703.1 hypothetical protein GCHA_3773 [Paraglaciecola chathamensis S18K6]
MGVNNLPENTVLIIIKLILLILSKAYAFFIIKFALKL